MNFALKTIDVALKMMNFGLKMMNFGLKMGRNAVPVVSTARLCAGKGGRPERHQLFGVRTGLMTHGAAGQGGVDAVAVVRAAGLR